ncbi:hypothetical protein [Mycobacterium sp.]|uniref:hypothetical protein n=1 Tax=Mycobacterium sp. TaxID=1785 RepID=UPI0031CFCD60
MNVRRFGRLCVLALGLSVAVAVTSSSGVAAADTPTDWWASTDGLLALPASSSGLDLAISYDGYTLLQDGDATAHPIAGESGLAIADGSGAFAYALAGPGSEDL